MVVKSMKNFKVRICIAGFLNLSAIDILAQIILQDGAGGGPVHFRVFSIISGLYPLDASDTFPLS